MRTRSHSNAIGVVGAFALGVSIALIPALAALAAPSPGVVPADVSHTEAGDASQSTTWSVRPGDANGADGRAWAEYSLNPGELVVDHLAITNHSAHDATFALSAADGYFTDTGRFNMLPSREPSVDAGTWIRLPESITLAAGETASVAFELAVPSNATPGDHPAGVAASILSDSGVVGIESRVGFRVMTRVAGEVDPRIEIDSTAAFRSSVNPFEAGAVEVEYTIVNAGNVIIGAQPRVVVSGPFGILSAEADGEAIVELAPGERRTATVVIRGAWPALFYDVRTTAEPIETTADQPDAAPAPVTSSTSVAALPWSQAVVLLAIAVLIVLWRLDRRKKSEDLAQRLEIARAEGRREAGLASR